MVGSLSREQGGSVVVASRWQPSGPAGGALLVCRNGHTMQFRLVKGADSGLTAVCTVEGCGDTALHVAGYQETEPGQAPAMPAAAMAPPPVMAPHPPLAMAGQHMAPPIMPARHGLPPGVPHTPSAAPPAAPPAAHAPAPHPPAAAPAVVHAPAPAPAPVPAPIPPPAPVFSPAFVQPRGEPSIREMIEHSEELRESMAHGRYSQEDFERVWPDSAPYDVPLGALAGSVPVDVRGRPATVSLPEGWRAWSASEIAGLPARDGSRHHLVLENAVAPKDKLFRLGVMTAPLKPPFDLMNTVIDAERQYNLDIAARVAALNFAGSTAYLWHFQGRVAGRILGRTEDLVPIHISEMHAPVGPYDIQLTVIAPVDKSRDAITAAHTVIASWRWLA